MSEEIETPAADAAAAPEPITLGDALERSMYETLDGIEAREKMPEKGEDGKFVSKNPVVAPVQATPAQAPDQPAQPDGGTPAASITAPDSWSAENKAKFATLPPDMQAYIAQREGEAHKAITQKGEQLAKFEPFARTLEPHRARIQGLGVDPAEYVGRILNAESLLQDPRTRVQALQSIARDYGIDLSQLTGQSTGQPGAQSAPQDPVTAALQSKLDRLETWATQRERQEQQAQQAAAARADREAESRATAFLNDPKFPYAKEVETDMASLIVAARNLGQNLSLEDAYKKATRSNETVWQKMEAEKAAAAKKEADAEAAKKAAEAKKRAPLIVKPRGTGAMAPSSKATMEERMYAKYDELNGAA